MDRRDALLGLLDAHEPADDKERQDLEGMRRHARGLEQPFSRGQPGAHFTASAVLVDPAGKRVCLVLHRKLGRWLQPGGHVEDSDASMADAALREAREETGCEVSLHPGAPGLLDVDAHGIPGRAGEPEHEHLDLRFLLRARDPEVLAHDPAESSGARWFSWDEALALADEPALGRLLRKARRAAGPQSSSSDV